MDRLPGAPYNPLSAAEVEEKFLSLSVPVLGEQRSQSVVETIRNLENLPDVSTLAALLTL
jgi:2-methylcitrate dehydratase PrpD